MKRFLKTFLCLLLALLCAGLSAVAGASVVRVHDVLETVQALRVVEALKG